MTTFYDIIFLYCCNYNGSQVDRKKEKTGPSNTIKHKYQYYNYELYLIIGQNGLYLFNKLSQTLFSCIKDFYKGVYHFNFNFLKIAVYILVEANLQPCPASILVLYSQIQQSCYFNYMTTDSKCDTYIIHGWLYDIRLYVFPKSNQIFKLSI